jgi:hypothetical protein
MDKIFDDLRREIGDTVAADQIASIGTDTFDRLSARAVIDDFIPLLVYRFTKEELVHARRGELQVAA